MDMRAACITLEYIVQRGNSGSGICAIVSEPRTGVEFPQLGKREGRNLATAVRRPVEGVVMNHHRHPIGAQVRIQLDVIEAGVYRKVECRDGVFRRAR